MHCQRETCKKITRKGGEYFLTVKKNQPELFEDVKFYFDNEKVERIIFTPKKTTRETSYCTSSLHDDERKIFAEDGGNFG